MACFEAFFDNLPWGRLAQERAEVGFLERELARTNAKAESIRQHKLDMEFECLRLAEESHQSQAAVDKLKQAAEQKRNDMYKASEESTRLQEDAAKYEAARARSEVDRESALDRYREAKREVQKAESEVEEAKRCLDGLREEEHRIEAEVESAKGELNNLRTELSDLRTEMVHVRRELRDTYNESARLARALQKEASAVASLQKQLRDMEDTRSGLHERWESEDFNTSDDPVPASIDESRGTQRSNEAANSCAASAVSDVFNAEQAARAAKAAEKAEKAAKEADKATAEAVSKAKIANAAAARDRSKSVERRSKSSERRTPPKRQRDKPAPLGAVEVKQVPRVSSGNNLQIQPGTHQRGDPSPGASSRGRVAGRSASRTRQPTVPSMFNGVLGPRTPTPVQFPILPGSKNAVPAPWSTKNSRWEELSRRHGAPKTQAAMREFIDATTKLMTEVPSSKDAGAVLRKALSLSESLFGKVHEDTLKAVNNYALYLELRGGKPEETKSLYMRAIEGRRRLCGYQDVATLDSMFNYATFLAKIGEDGQSEMMFMDTRTGSVKEMGLNHHASLECTWASMILLEKKGDDDEALRLAQEHIAYLDTDLGPNHPDTVKTLVLTATIMTVRANPDSTPEKIIKFVKDVLRRNTQVHGVADEGSSTLGYNLAVFMVNHEQEQEGIDQLKELLETCEKDNGVENSATLGYMEDLATLLLEALERPKEAAPYLRKLVDARTKVLGPGHEDTLRVGRLLATCIDPEEAVAVYRTIVKHQAEVSGLDDAQTLEDRYQFSIRLYEAKQTDECIKEISSVMTKLETNLGFGDNWVVNCATKLGELYRIKADYEKAEALFRRVVQHFQARLAGELESTDEDDEDEDMMKQDVADSSFNLALTLLQSGKNREAEEYFQISLSHFQLHLEQGGEEIRINTKKMLAKAIEAQGAHRLVDASALWEEVAADATVILGKSHPTTLEVEDHCSEISAIVRHKIVNRELPKQELDPPLSSGPTVRAG